MDQQQQMMDSASAALIAGALPMPLLVVGPTQQIVFVNPAAEQFFDSGAGLLLRQTLTDEAGHHKLLGCGWGRHQHADAR